MARMKVIKDGNNEYWVEVKRKNQYPFVIHKRFYSEAAAKNFIKLNRKKYK